MDGENVIMSQILTDNQVRRFGKFWFLALWTIACIAGTANKGVADMVQLGVTVCGAGIDRRDTPVTINSHDSLANPPVGDITLTKNCYGPVIGTFTAAINTTLHLHQRRAKCISNGGFAGGCNPFSLPVDALPSHTEFHVTGAAQISDPVVAASWMWSNLPRGVWRFHVQPAAFSAVIISNSTFTVEAFQRP